MTVLTPAPNSLGLESPTLGPWFSTDLTLPVPGDDLSVTVAVPAGTDWLPPASGLLSLAVATAALPPVLAGLRGPAGTPPFTTGRLVATFRLLPEVEARLGTLLADVPRADGTTAVAGQVTRATVRTFALELPEDPPTLAVLKTRIDPPIPALSSPSEEAAHVGLTQSGGNLGNASEPMRDLKRAGSFLSANDKLLAFPAGATVRLLAFDTRGRAIDPGAVAAWWARLATSFTNLFADGVSTRTATTAPQLTAVLCGPDEGPATAGVLSRLSASGVTGSGAVRVRSGSAAAAFALTAGSVDDAPLPLAAALPAGTYGSTVSLWASGAVGNVTRDCVRVALVDVEGHLTGQPRTSSGAGDPQRRAADQARASTRTLVDRATTAAGQNVLLATSDEAMAGLVGVLAAGSATMVAPVLDRAAGALTAPTLPAVAAPPVLPNPVTMRALTGGGTASGATVTSQRVLVETTFDPALAGAWLRVWPQYFDSETGRHVRGAGGGGLIDPTGAVRVVVRLADGAVTPLNRMGLDLLLVTGTQAVRYPEVRLERPAPIGGTAIALSAATGTVTACESGQSFTGPVPAGALASGATLVQVSDPPALIDAASIPVTAWSAATIAAGLTSGDTVQLTQPPWNGWRGGESAATLAASTSATVTEILRTGLTRLAQVGAPLPTQSRDEVAAAVLTATVADGLVAGVTPLGVHHELLPHQSGHPGAPGDDERHGAGARLRGPAVLGLTEILRERVAGTTPELALDATTALAPPAAPSVPGSWAATLRTVGFGVEAEPGLTAALNAIGAAEFPFDGAISDVRAWLSGLGVTIPSSVDAAATSVQRALNRRLLGAGRGYREAATALSAAFGRAQDLVYIETPALDGLAIGTGDAALNVWQALVDRAGSNPALRVIVCLPTRLAPGAPAKLQRVRDKGVQAALDALRTAAGDRLAVFNAVTGPGRSLHLDATSVVVDDAWALTGGTHLWRRGLSFDASLAVAVFDERLLNGRPADVVTFRRALVAGRLGLPASLLPEDPEELVLALRALSSRGGGQRLSPDVIEAPDPVPSDVDVAVWNPDGSPVSSFDAMAWLVGLTAAVQAELAAEVPGSP
jgi:hypothetical protein